ASKATPYEESIRIPLIVRYPARLAGGRRSRTLFNSVDVLPTLMALAALPVPPDVQGRDLSHAALGVEGEEPDSVYLQILGPGWPHRKQWTGLWRGVRTHDYTYARWHDLDGMRILYDLRSDPFQMSNLADSPEHADLAEQAEGRLQRWMAETRDPFDSGRRLGETRMLELGQALASLKAHQWLPEQYARAIEPNYANFRTGERVEIG
ncbi:MAG: sulfatase/phosphatase domain-containing protein, partial [Planctomycetota bacterium]